MRNSLPLGGNIPLTQENPSLNLVHISVTYGGRARQDTAQKTQVGVILCGADGKALNHEGLIYSHQISHPTTPVTFEENEAYRFSIRLKEIPEEVDRVDLVLWNEGSSQLGFLDGVQVSLFDDSMAPVVSTWALTPSSAYTAAILVRLYRHRGQWKLRSIGDGWTMGLPQLLVAYGIGG